MELPIKGCVSQQIVSDQIKKVHQQGSGDEND